MIKVTRKEADMLREKAPSAHIAIVNRQHRSKEKTYYAEENRETVRLLNAARGIVVPEQERRPRDKRRGNRNWR